MYGEVILMVIKIIAIVFFSLYLGNKTGFFSLKRFTSLIMLIVLGCIFSLEIYSSFFRNDVSLLIVFKSSFYNLTLDLSFFLRIFFGTLLVGIICSVFGVKPGVKINTVKELCTLAVLISIAVVLAIYGTVRIGTEIKVSLKFIPVFVAAACFGPIWGGAVGAIADIIAFFVNPVGGVFLPQITFVEFLYGFIFGLFFYDMGSWKGAKAILKVIFCVLVQIIFLNLGLTTYFLTGLMNMSFELLLVRRSVSALVSLAIHLVVLVFMAGYMPAFKKIVK